MSRYAYDAAPGHAAEIDELLERFGEPFDKCQTVVSYLYWQDGSARDKAVLALALKRALWESGLVHEPEFAGDFPSTLWARVENHPIFPAVLREVIAQLGRDPIV